MTETVAGAVRKSVTVDDVTKRLIESNGSSLVGVPVAGAPSAGAPVAGASGE